MLHITNGNIQLGLRPRSKTELTTHHKHSPTGNLLPLPSFLCPEASAATEPAAAQISSELQYRTHELITGQDSNPTPPWQTNNEKLTINQKELDLGHRFLAQKKAKPLPPSQASPPGPSSPLQQSAFSSTNTAESKQGAVQTPCPSQLRNQLKNPSRSHLHL